MKENRICGCERWKGLCLRTAQHTWTFQTDSDPGEEADPRCQMAGRLTTRINGEEGVEVEAFAGPVGLLADSRSLMERARLSWVR